MAPDPYARYLQQAEELFSGGEILRAGQIWQAVLKQVPDHAAAREGLQRLKAALDAKAAAQAAPAQDFPTTALPLHRDPEPEAPVPVAEPAPAAQATMDEDTQDKLLREGCTLYDMGQMEDALRKWDQLLAAVPDHAMALLYVKDARKELGLPLDGSVSPTSPQPVHHATQEIPLFSADEESADKLLREGCLLYDMGLSEEAVGKWEKAIKLAPHRADIQSFLDSARKDIAEAGEAVSPVTPTQALPKPTAPSPAPSLSPADEKVKQAEHLMGMQRFEEAAFSYQQVLDFDPNHAGAKAGLARCRAAQDAPAQPASPVSGSGPVRAEHARIEMNRSEPEPEPAPAQPPAALTKPAPAPRSGLQVKVPENFDVSKMPTWAKDPKIWAAGAGAILLIVVGSIWYKGYARDSQLQADVAAAHRAAVAKAARDAQVPSLAESAGSILSEGKQALGSGDAVRAYLRAQTLLKRDPSNGAAAQLLDQAKASLPLAGLVGATAEEYQQHLHEGDLDQAGKVMDALLRANPDDPNLRTQALRLSLRLAEDHASQGRWGDAQANLELGRALAPDDSAWSARMALLSKIQTMPKGDRALWIAMLG